MLTKAKSITKSPTCYLCFGKQVFVVVYWCLLAHSTTMIGRSSAGFHGHDATTIEQIGAFYLAFTGAQLPAAAFASMFIALIRVLDILCARRFGRLLLIIWWVPLVSAVRWPWKSAHDLDQFVPIIASLISILILIAIQRIYYLVHAGISQGCNQRYFTR